MNPHSGDETEFEAIDAVLQLYSQQGRPQPRHQGTGEDATVPAEQPIEPVYANVNDWANRWLLPTVERRVAEGSRPGVYWCARWWSHPEALQRIYALWRHWEVARFGDRLSEWWHHHLDAHLRSLTGEHGPFVRCSPSRHYQPMHLPSLPIPQVVSNLLPEDAGDASVVAGHLADDEGRSGS